MWKSGRTSTPVRTAIAGGALLASLIVASIAFALADAGPATASGATRARQASDRTPAATTSARRRRHHRKCRRGYVRRRARHHGHYYWRCVRRHKPKKKPAASPPAGTQPTAPTGGDSPTTGTTPPASGQTPPLSSAEPPAPIAGQGYHQVFRDDFNTLDRSVWDNHIWYDETPNPAWGSDFQSVDSNGILHLHSARSMIGDTGEPYPYNTITTQSSGKTFQYGYFEVRMKWPKGDGAWPGFWLYSYKHATDSGQCTTQAGEIDVMEGQGSEPDNWYGTVHSNTNGCSPSDNQNGNNFQETNTDLTAGFHTYAVKWTASSVTWYLDGVQTHSAPTYATDNQQMFLLLQEWTGGWTKDPDSTTPADLDNQIDYVTAWQQ